MIPVEAEELPIVPDQSGHHSELQANQNGYCLMNEIKKKTASRAEGPLLSVIN